MREILFAFCVLMSPICLSAPQWIKESFENLDNSDYKIREKASYNISSYYTDAGGSGEIDVVFEYIDKLIGLLDDSTVAANITDLFAGRYLTDNNGHSFTLVDKLDDVRKATVIEKIKNNISSEDSLIFTSSAYALINSTKCENFTLIKSRAIEFGKIKPGSYESDYVLKKLAAVCNGEKYP